MRASGILLPVFSLPSPYGIGTMGQSAFDFIDFLHRAGQRYWQVLPIGPTSFGDSPYQSFSTFAGNPYLIDLDLLCGQGLLDKEEITAVPCPPPGAPIDYAGLFETRFGLLKKAHNRFQKTADFDAFVQAQAYWLPDYALFMALKADNGHASWQEWEAPLRFREPAALLAARKRLENEIAFYLFLQYVFYAQWARLKAYAGQKNVMIIGDIPIYVAMDSADIWVHKELFMLSDDLAPTFVAGCPPDYFSKTGQLWGNPLYRWEAHEKDGFAWWIRRIEASFTFFDVLRIDHFRGFASYYAIPFGQTTAEHGTWEQGPGMKLFSALKAKVKNPNIIAEDLGFLTADVFELLKQTGFPGMKVLQFAFEPYADSAYLPHHYTKKCVVYTGTHDNTTVNGWMKTASPKEKKFAIKYLSLRKREGYPFGFIRGAWASVADTAIAPMQDVLALDASARTNTPSTVGGNWLYRLRGDELTDALAARLAEITRRYGRNAT